MIQFILKQDIINFIKTLAVDHDVYYLTDKQELAKYSDEQYLDAINIDLVRAITPLKSFFFLDTENVDTKYLQKESRVIFGVKSCDLKAKNILDRIFLEGDCVDPLYKYHQDNTIIIASDCPCPKESCWCSYVGGQPFATEKFDLNFSPANDGYIVETGSETGEKILNQAQAFFKEITQEHIKQRDLSRKLSFEKLDEINSNISSIKNTDFRKLYGDKYFSEKWKKLSENCVQCLGCNKICPSCYCFYLSENTKKEFDKAKHWDACHSASYSRVAGGANSRPKVYERFRNRYECKFNYRMTNFGQYACTGCGRCFDVSPCKIDIRQVSLELSK